VKHSLLEEYSDSIFLFLPTYKSLGAISLGLIFLLPWSFGWVLMITSLISGRIYALNPTQSPIFLTLFGLFGFISWTIAGAYILYSITRMYFGLEVVEITEKSFTVRQQILGFSNERTYSLLDIWNLRTIAKQPVTPFKNQYKPWNGQGDHTLAFDYRLGTVRFGAGISESKATKILEIVQEKFPRYKTRDQILNNHWHSPRKDAA
jgi:hypothetical protein